MKYFMVPKNDCDGNDKFEQNGQHDDPGKKLLVGALSSLFGNQKSRQIETDIEEL